MLTEAAVIGLNRTRLKEKIAMQYRQMGLLVAAGMPAAQALTTLIESCRSFRVKRILNALLSDLENAARGAEAVSAKPAYYNPGLIYALNHTKDPDLTARILNTTADQMESTAALTDRITASVIYPAATLFVAVACCWVLLVFVVPVFGEMFRDFGAQLPGPTLFVIGMSRFLVDNTLYLILGLIGVAAVLMLFKQKTIEFASRIPLLNRLAEKKAVYQFSSFFHLIGSHDVPLKDAVYYAGKAVDNPYFKKVFMRAADSVTSRAEVAKVLETTGLFPDIAVKAMNLENGAGKQGEIFGYIAQYFEKDLKRDILKNIGFFDAFFIVLIGLIVGGMVIAMYLPIFSMAGAIG